MKASRRMAAHPARPGQAGRGRAVGQTAFLPGARRVFVFVYIPVGATLIQTRLPDFVPGSERGNGKRCRREPPTRYTDAYPSHYHRELCPELTPHIHTPKLTHAQSLSLEPNFARS